MRASTLAVSPDIVSPYLIHTGLYLLTSIYSCLLFSGKWLGSGVCCYTECLLTCFGDCVWQWPWCGQRAPLLKLKRFTSQLVTSLWSSPVSVRNRLIQLWLYLSLFIRLVFLSVVDCVVSFHTNEPLFSCAAAVATKTDRKFAKMSPFDRNCSTNSPSCSHRTDILSLDDVN